MTLRNRVEFLIFVLVRRLVWVVPTRIADAFGTRVASPVFAARGKRVGYALKNLRIAFPKLSESRRREIGRRSYENFAHNLIDVAHSQVWSEAEFHSRIEIVGLLIDQVLRRARVVFVPLVEVRCSTSAGLATLALRTGASVVPFSMLRDGPDHHRAVVLSALEFLPTGERKHDIEARTTLCNEVLEDLIRHDPEQWMWAHRRFRHSPGLPEPVYARQMAGSPHSE